MGVHVDNMVHMWRFSPIVGSGDQTRSSGLCNKYCASLQVNEVLLSMTQGNTTIFLFGI